MRRRFQLKSKKLLAGPYLFWSVSFIIIPLLMIFYYGLTDQDGAFTFANLAKITTPENLKALGLALLLSLISTLICLVMAYPLAMILASMNVNQTSFIVLIFILPMWMNFFAPHARMADFIRKEWCDQQYSVVFPPAAACNHQHTLCDHSWYGL